MVSSSERSSTDASRSESPERSYGFGSAWDSGGDLGTTYLADDAEADPKQATTAASGRHFAPDGAARPVARLTFTRL